jgi:4-hydroxyphenylpyruvate dioxygenase
MDIDHAHFYVADAQRSRDWFVNTLGFRAIAHRIDQQIHSEIVAQGGIFFVLSSPLGADNSVTDFLQHQSAGVADLALRVKDLAAVLATIQAAGGKVLQDVQTFSNEKGQLRWAKIQGWGRLQHTLLERSGQTLQLAGYTDHALEHQDSDSFPLMLGIDHAVLNVYPGDLKPAIAWYQKILGLQTDSSFVIQTDRSALHSQVLVHPEGSLQLPINEPASKSSQIQEFLDFNHGSGIQHLAIATGDIVMAIAQLRQLGLSFLDIPERYYAQLQAGLKAAGLDFDLLPLQQQRILMEWQLSYDPVRILLQAFTQPIFDQPTFFFELIERRFQAQGFGERNFLALFQAIEQEQIRRGTL